MHLSVCQRLVVLLLAMLPIAWGNCPGWFGGGGIQSDGAARESGSTLEVCPCCAKQSHDSHPSRGCDECPIVAVRRTASPVPPTVELPPPLLVGLLLAPRLDVTQPLDAVVASRIAPIPPGRPPDLVGTVVLVV